MVMEARRREKRSTLVNIESGFAGEDRMKNDVLGFTYFKWLTALNLGSYKFLPTAGYCYITGINQGGTYGNISQSTCPKGHYNLYPLSSLRSYSPHPQGPVEQEQPIVPEWKMPASLLWIVVEGWCIRKYVYVYYVYRGSSDILKLLTTVWDMACSQSWSVKRCRGVFEGFVKGVQSDETTTNTETTERVWQVNEGRRTNCEGFN